jgi:hypothetical protein
MSQEQNTEQKEVVVDYKALKKELKKFHTNNVTPKKAELLNKLNTLMDSEDQKELATIKQELSELKMSIKKLKETGKSGIQTMTNQELEIKSDANKTKKKELNRRAIIITKKYSDNIDDLHAELMTQNALWLKEVDAIKEEHGVRAEDNSAQERFNDHKNEIMEQRRKKKTSQQRPGGMNNTNPEKAKTAERLQFILMNPKSAKTFFKQSN